MKEVFDPESFGLAIKAIRKSKHITQVDLAEKCGICTSTMVQIENGKQNATLPTLFKISNELGVKIYVEE